MSSAEHCSLGTNRLQINWTAGKVINILNYFNYYFSLLNKKFAIFLKYFLCAHLLRTLLINWIELCVNIYIVACTAFIKLCTIYCKFISCVQLNNMQLINYQYN